MMILISFDDGDRATIVPLNILIVQSQASNGKIKRRFLVLFMN